MKLPRTRPRHSPSIWRTCHWRRRCAWCWNRVALPSRARAASTGLPGARGIGASPSNWRREERALERRRIIESIQRLPRREPRPRVRFAHAPALAGFAPRPVTGMLPGTYLNGSWAVPAVTPYPRRVQPAPPQSGSQALRLWPTSHSRRASACCRAAASSWRFRRKARLLSRGLSALHHPLHRAHASSSAGARQNACPCPGEIKAISPPLSRQDPVSEEREEAFGINAGADAGIGA